MRRYRYSAWNDSLGCFHPGPEDVLDGMADSIIEHGDLRKALRLLMQQGFTDRRGRFLPGLRDLRERLSEIRQLTLAESDSKDMVWDWWLMEMERLDRILDGVSWGSDADTIDDDLVGRILGNEARRQVLAFKELPESLEPYI